MLLCVSSGGYAFDGVFLGEAHNHTMYAQWRGWANVLEQLKTLHPEIVIDNRLSAHGEFTGIQLYGARNKIYIFTERMGGTESRAWTVAYAGRVLRRADCW